jgi:uncharacterized membrane protein YesL
MARGQMEGIHLFLILSLNSLTMNYVKFELVHLPRIVIMLKFLIMIQNFIYAVIMFASFDCEKNHNYILVGPWFDSCGTLLLNTLGAIER